MSKQQTCCVCATASGSVNSLLPQELQKSVCSMAEVIFLQTDPTFNLVLSAMMELRDNERLPLPRTTVQRAYIDRIERPVRPLYIWKRKYDFSRTASVCFRMAMLEATGIPRDLWPETVSTEGNTREGNMHREPDPVVVHLYTAAISLQGPVTTGPQEAVVGRFTALCCSSDPRIPSSGPCPLSYKCTSMVPRRKGNWKGAMTLQCSQWHSVGHALGG